MRDAGFAIRVAGYGMWDVRWRKCNSPFERGVGGCKKDTRFEMRDMGYEMRDMGYEIRDDNKVILNLFQSL